MKVNVMINGALLVGTAAFYRILQIDIPDICYNIRIRSLRQEKFPASRNRRRTQRSPARAGSAQVGSSASCPKGKARRADR